jgi:hypothetical protein
MDLKHPTPKFNNQIQIRISENAIESFIEDLKTNKIEYTQNGNHFLFNESTPKLRMAIQMVKERYGARSMYDVF